MAEAGYTFPHQLYHSDYAAVFDESMGNELKSRLHKEFAKLHLFPEKRGVLPFAKNLQSSGFLKKEEFDALERTKTSTRAAFLSCDIRLKNENLLTLEFYAIPRRVLLRDDMAEAIVYSDEYTFLIRLYHSDYAAVFDESMGNKLKSRLQPMFAILRFPEKRFVSFAKNLRSSGFLNKQQSDAIKSFTDSFTAVRKLNAFPQKGGDLTTIYPAADVLSIENTDLADKRHPEGSEKRSTNRKLLTSTEDSEKIESRMDMAKASETLVIEKPQLLTSPTQGVLQGNTMDYNPAIQQETLDRAERNGSEISSAIEKFKYSFDHAMKKVNREIELSSYYLSPNNDLIVHPVTADKAQILEKRLRDLVNQHDVHDIVNIVVKPDPAVATACHRLSSGNEEHNLGMYITENGLVYWLSVAHALVKRNVERSWHTADASCSLHTGDVAAISIRLPSLNPAGSASYKSFSMPTPYVCFSMSDGGFLLPKNAVDFSSQTRGKMLPKPQDHFLYHGVDIMVGPTTMLSEEGLGNCFPMATLSSEQSANSFKLVPVNIKDLPKEQRQNGERFNADVLMHQALESYSWVHGKTLKGTVKYVNRSIRFVFDKEDKVHKMLQNAIFIKCDGDHEPRLGHSGSVWILRKSTPACNTSSARANESHMDEHNKIFKSAVPTTLRDDATVGETETSEGTTEEGETVDAPSALASSMRKNSVVDDDKTVNCTGEHFTEVEPPAVASADSEHPLLDQSMSASSICEPNADIEVVAMTLATYSDSEGSFWVAAPICSSLYALRKAFQRKFPEQGRFTALGILYP